MKELERVRPHNEETHVLAGLMHGRGSKRKQKIGFLKIKHKIGFGKQHNNTKNSVLININGIKSQVACHVCAAVTKYQPLIVNNLRF